MTLNDLIHVGNFVITVVFAVFMVKLVLLEEINLNITVNNTYSEEECEEECEEDNADTSK